MSRAPELFTPEGFSPALAELNLEFMHIPEQLVAAEGILRRYGHEQWLTEVADTFAARRIDHRDWGAEKPTHFAHLLGSADPEDPYSARVYLHHYKGSAPSRERRFTEIDHNHQDGVVSRILDSGYSAVERRFPDELPNSVETLRSVPQWRQHYLMLEEREEPVEYTKGDIMSIHPDEVHRLERVDRDALTLVVRLPVRRSFSVKFMPDSHEPMILDDMPARRQHLASIIGDILTS